METNNQDGHGTVDGRSEALLFSWVPGTEVLLSAICCAYMDYSINCTTDTLAHGDHFKLFERRWYIVNDVGENPHILFFPFPLPRARGIPSRFEG